MSSPTEVRLSRHRVQLVLHLLQRGALSSVPLLRLHALGGRAVEPGPCGTEPWPGPVWGLDFTGHGASSRPVGGGYSPELLMADADAALGHLGPVVVAGWGLGAYVGLLLAGARPALVRGLVLAEGAGLAGAATDASVPGVLAYPPPPLPLDAVAAGADPTADPYAWAELQRDPRPAAYALGYLRRAAGQADRAGGPIAVVAVGGGPQPAWLSAVEAEPSVLGRDRLHVVGDSSGPLRVAAGLALMAATAR